MGDDLDDLLAIEGHEPLQALARRLVESDVRLLDDLIKMRQAHKLTQEQVGQRMGVTQPAVAALERADADPKLSTIRRYALAIGALIEHAVTEHPSPMTSVISNTSPAVTGSAWVSVDVEFHQSSSIVEVVR